MSQDITLLLLATGACFHSRTPFSSKIVVKYSGLLNPKSMEIFFSSFRMILVVYRRHKTFEPVAFLLVSIFCFLLWELHSC